MHQLIGWVLTIPERRAWAPFLIAANLFGAIYGIYWYWGQLVTTRWWFWPIVPDSPFSNFLFALFLVFWYYRRQVPHWLAALAILGMIKYGGWTALLFAQLFGAGYPLSAMDLWLTLSHLAMLTEALLFIRYLRLPPGPVLLAIGWYLFNDCLDYVWGFHPTLPAPQFLFFVAIMAVSLTGLGGALLWWGSVRGSGQQWRAGEQ